MLDCSQANVNGGVIMKNQKVKKTFKASSFFVRVEIKEQSSLYLFLTFQCFFSILLVRSCSSVN